MGAVFALLILVAMVIASLRGASVPPTRLVNHWLARVCLALALFAIFFIAASTAAYTGCNLVMGPMNFH